MQEIDPTYFEAPSDAPSLTSSLPTGAGEAMDGPTVPKTPTSQSSQAQDPPTLSPSPSPKSSSGRRKAQAPVALHIKVTTQHTIRPQNPSTRQDNETDHVAFVMRCVFRMATSVGPSCQRVTLLVLPKKPPLPPLPSRSVMPT